MRTRFLLLTTALATTALAADGAWTSEADVGVNVNGHTFRHIRVDGDGCDIAVGLAFDAPATGYSDPGNAVRNYHLFRARLKLGSGKVAESRTFGNGGPGKRAYSYHVDTTHEGCWSRDPDKAVKLDVIGCRGRGCDPGTFE